MENTKADFYSGYEGEPEVVFVLTGRSSGSIHAWEGHVDAILGAVPPGPLGRLEGLLLPYHLLTGCWGDEQEMVVEEVVLFAAQLAAVNTSCFESETRRFHEALQELIQRAVSDSGELRISRF